MAMYSKLEKVKTAIALQGWEGLLRRYSCFRDAFTKMDEHKSTQVPCPFGGQGSTKFRFVFKNKDFNSEAGAYHEDLGYLDGIALIEHAERCSTGEALDIIADYCGGLDKVTNGMSRQYQARTVKKELSQEEKEKRNAAICKVAQYCVHASQSEVVERYLRNRGLKGDMALLPKNLYFNPNLFYFEEETKQKSFWPGLVAVVTDSNWDTVSLHRHYITQDGKKAPVGNAKKMMAPNVMNMNGSSIKLDEPIYLDGFGGVLGVCEGLETALAVREATGMPMWAGIDANKMRSMEIPEDVKTVVIWADHDRSETGIDRSKTLKERLEEEVPDRQVIVHCPDELNIPTNAKSVDWLDVYVHLGAEYFPTRIYNESYQVKTGVPVLDIVEGVKAA